MGVQVELHTCLTSCTTFRRGGGGELHITPCNCSRWAGWAHTRSGRCAGQEHQFPLPQPGMKSRSLGSSATSRCTLQCRAETSCYRSKKRKREGRLQAHNEFCLYRQTQCLAVYYHWQLLAGWRNEGKIYSYHGDRNVYRLAVITENLLSVNGVGWAVIYTEYNFTWTKMQPALLVQWRQ